MSELVHTIFDFLSSLGYMGIALGLMVEVIPSEIVLSYGGYLIHSGHINFFGALIAGVIGGTIAQLFLYWIALYGGRPFIDRYGKYILIKSSHVDASEKWFLKYGTGMIFLARFIPVVRHAISIPAGLARMPIGQFTLYTTAAIIPWTVLFLLLGMRLGDHWGNIETYAKPYITPIIIGAVVLLAAYVLLQFRKKKNK
ncbi:DedA family protein [Niallia taxi]|uniref:DedA family protein n=1 Tax=Niallia taxi TaxID=2499688 RepID=UPI0039821BA0